VLFELGRREEALTACEKALELNPWGAQIWFNKGVLLGNNGQFREALDCFEQARRLGHQKAGNSIAICRRKLKGK
jgi:tetratricopeptide (TPR) repeat protein